MESQREFEDDLNGHDDDLIFDQEDVAIERADNLHSISFSLKVHAQLIKPWQHTVLVKLLGRHIGY